MATSALTKESRSAALASMSDGVDILVVGGGVTGAGIVLDAVTRGLNVGIVESQDWSSGTSSRSSKLVHGGLRYLQMLDFHLVHEALRERDLLLSTIAPHLVRPVSFLYPLHHRVWERGYVGAGVTLYDALAAVAGRRRAMPTHRHISAKGIEKLFPDMRSDVAIGAIRYWDARVDDARLVLTLVRTAASYGAHVAARTEVVDYLNDSSGAVIGARLRDLETGEEHDVPAKHVINATGVWTERTEAMAGSDGGLKVLASKGIHIVVPKERIDGSTGIILQTEKSVLFIIPWERYWIIGTTDTPWELDVKHPVATSADIDYVLEHANEILARPLTRDDIIGTFAGLRPLLQPGTKEGTSSSKVSREHTVASPVPGLTVIAGGKLTTYRVMAKDAVDFALGDRADELPSITEDIELLGASGYAVYRRQRRRIARRYGWDAPRINGLLGRYGSLLPELLALIDADPSLAKPLTAAPDYLRAEITYAATHEGVIHLEDVLVHRTRLNYEVRDRGVGALDEIGAIVAETLGWDDARRRAEIESYRDRAAAEAAAEQEPDDATAETARLRAVDIAPTVAPTQGMDTVPSE